MPSAALLDAPVIRLKYMPVRISPARNACKRTRRRMAHLFEVRHHLGSEHLHTAHDLPVWNLTARIEPADHAAHVEVLPETLQPLNTGFGRVEYRHPFADLLVGHARETFQRFLEARRGVRPCGAEPRSPRPVE